MAKLHSIKQAQALLVLMRQEVERVGHGKIELPDLDQIVEGKNDKYFTRRTDSVKQPAVNPTSSKIIDMKAS